MDPLLVIAAAAVAVVLVLILLALALRRSTQAEHSPEYTSHLASDDWSARRRSCLAWTHRRCCLFPWLRAIEAHHLHYTNLRRERTIRDLVPLSAAGHRVAHAWIFWRGPFRPLANGWMRCSTIALALAVRPLLLITVMLLLGSGAVLSWPYCQRAYDQARETLVPLLARAGLHAP